MDDTHDSVSGLESSDSASYHIKAQYTDREFFEHREVFLRHLFVELQNHVSPTTDVANSKSCLDIGCNAGRYTAMLAECGYAVRGVDFDKTLLEEARLTYPGIDFDHGDAQELPYDDDSFDVVTSLGLIQVLPDWRGALAETVRVLKPGGIALVETNRAFPFWEYSLKFLSYVVRREMPLKDSVNFFRTHWQRGDKPLSEGIRCFSRDELFGEIAALPVPDIYVHDLRKHRFLHDFNWAVLLTKSAAGDRSQTGISITDCEDCRTGAIFRTHA